MHPYLVIAALGLTAYVFGQTARYYRRQLQSARAQSNLHQVGSAFYSFLLYVRRFPSSVMELEGFLNGAAGVANPRTSRLEHLLDRAEIDLDDYVGSLVGRTVIDLDPVNFRMTVVVHAGQDLHLSQDSFVCTDGLRERLVAA